MTERKVNVALIAALVLDNDETKRRAKTRSWIKRWKQRRFCGNSTGAAHGRYRKFQGNVENGIFCLFHLNPIYLLKKVMELRKYRQTTDWQLLYVFFQLVKLANGLYFSFRYLTQLFPILWFLFVKYWISLLEKDI